MEQILEVGGQRYIIGLEWNPLSGSDPLLAARTLAKARKSPLGLLRTINTGDGQVIHQAGLAQKKVKGVILAGAAQLANISPSMIAIDRLSEDLYWLCVTDNGRVLPGHDAVASDSEVRRLFNDLAEDYQLDYMRLVMTEEVAQTLSIGRVVENISPLDLLETTPPGDNLKLKNLVGVSNTTILGAIIGIMLVGGGGYWKYTDQIRQREYEEQMALEAMEAEAAEKARLAGIKKGPTDDEILAKAREEEVGWLRDEFNQKNLINSLKHVYVLSSTMPIREEGWELQGISFNSENLRELRTAWKRDGGNLKGIKDALAGKGNVFFSSDFKQANASHKISLGDRGIQDIEAFLKTRGMRQHTLVDIFLAENLEFGVTVTTKTERKSTIEGLKDKNLESVPQLTVKKWLFAISGQDVDSYIKLMNILQQVDNMTPETIDVSRVDGAFVWKFTGTLQDL
ncbi:hypothetical protein [Pseudomonas sp. PLMAX]|uniref:hypothetical protein n=1 Tax=Pseudomonas sp. PLMAX TaxID=2201998 RepID=UPI0038BD8711